jgi:hypothetical protein
VISVGRIALLSPGAAIAVEAVASIKKPLGRALARRIQPFRFHLESRMDSPSTHNDCLLALLDKTIGSPSMIFTLSTDPLTQQQWITLTVIDDT